MKLKFLMLFLALLVSSAAFGADDTTVVDAESMSQNTVWKDNVVVVRSLRVPKGVTLAIKPGTVVGFNKGAGLEVEGVLKAEGRKGAPVTFTSAEAAPAPGDWSGISFSEAGEGSSLKYCRVEYANAVSIAVCSPLVQNCEFTKGMQGLVMARKCVPQLKGNRITDMTNGGIQCQMGSEPVIAGNTMERCGPYGIVSGQDSHPVIKGNTVSGCEVGINLSQPVPPVEDNVLRKNKVGILSVNANYALVLRGNHVLDCETGILCQQFSSPVIEHNELSGNKEGIVCFRASSPLIKNNEVAMNEKGIVCVQICNPRINLNDIHDNKKAVYLDLSSYALVNGNNIYDNEVQLELGNMSSDWERRVNNKPMRGSQAQNVNLASRGRAVAQQLPDTAEIMGAVDATGNWWGPTTTDEMDRKGPDADIKEFTDYYDVPTRTYEGYSGVYTQDRISYKGWKRARIKEAGR